MSDVEKFHYFRRIISSSVAAPGVRVVVLYSRFCGIYGDDGSPVVDVGVIPILAVRSRVVERYRLPVGPGSGDSLSLVVPRSVAASVLFDDGWVLDCVDSEEDLLVYIPFDGLGDKLVPVGMVDVCEEGEVVISRVLVCAWPVVEDDVRVGSLLAGLRDRVCGEILKFREFDGGGIA